jgi:type I restriction enzyme S subunit
VGTLGELGEIICGKTPPTADKDNYGGDIPFITIPDMHDKVFVTRTTSYLTEKGAATQQKKLLPKYSVCVSCIATPGLVAITSFPSHTNQQINSIICYPEISPYWCYLAIINIRQEIINGGAGGSATLNLNKGEFSKLQVIKPDDKAMNRFHNLVGPIFSQILANDLQSMTLSDTRDTLLPKLLSGEIRVRDAERFIERRGG